MFKHSETEEAIVRTLSYSLPRELHRHVQVITPTTMFGTMRGMKKTSFLRPAIPLESLEESVPLVGQAGQAVPSSCNNAITPSCLQALYQTSGFTPKATAKNSIGVAGYLEEFANTADLQVRSCHHHTA